MRYLFIIIFIMQTMNVVAQQKKRIEYMISDDVKSKILKIVDKKNEKYYIIWNTRNDTTSVLLCKVDSSSRPLMDVLEFSNRFIQVDEENREIPVILNSDLLFSTYFNVLENKGEKYESMTTILLNPSGFLIKFIGRFRESKIIYFDFFQY